MEQTIRERAQALLKLANKATDGPWIPYENHIADSGWECVVEDVRPNDQDFIVASRTEGPYLAQKLIEAFDLLKCQVQFCMKCGGTGWRHEEGNRDDDAPYACYACSPARQFLKERMAIVRKHIL